MEINPAGEPLFDASAARLLHSCQQTEQPNQPQQQAQQQSTPSHPLTNKDVPTLDYLVAAAGSQPDAFLAGADVVIVDPPRKVCVQSQVMFSAPEMDTRTHTHLHTQTHTRYTIHTCVPGSGAVLTRIPCPLRLATAPSLTHGRPYKCTTRGQPFNR